MTTPDTAFDRETVTRFLKFIWEETMPDGCEMTIVTFQHRYSKLMERFPTLEPDILYRLLRKDHIVDLIDDDKLASVQVTMEDFFWTEPGAFTRFIEENRWKII